MDTGKGQLLQLALIAPPFFRKAILIPKKNVMKFLLTALASLALTLSASADISVNWVANGPIFAAGTGPTPTVPTDFIPADATFQLIWTPNSMPSTPVLPTPDALGGGEVLLAEGTRADLVNSSYGSAAADEFHGGNVYGRVFSENTSAGTPGFYALTDFRPTGDGTNPITLDYTDLAGEGETVTFTAAGNPVQGNVLFVDTPIVPEPGSLALIALGGVLLAVFRRRR